MKTLKEYQDEIYKCSRCALCQSVCPVYKATLNECAVSKGKFNMLNGVIKGELSLSKQLKKYLDLCTGCNACKNFCPSGIDARKIFIAVKSDYHKFHKHSLFEKIINSYVFFKSMLAIGKISFSLYRFFKIDFIVDKSKHLLLKTGFVGKKILLLNFLAKKQYNLKSNKNNNQKTKTAIFFEGCFNKYINSQTKDAVEKILSNSNIKLTKRNFNCCGISYLSDGNINEFKKTANKNISLCDGNFDYIITDCASCNDVLKTYKDYIDDSRAIDIAKKVVSVSELISKMEFTSSKNIKIAIHKPCHEDFDLENFVKNNIKNIEYIEIEDYDKCCGFSGTFAIKNPQISTKISKQKTQKYIENDVDIILTTCPACLLGLEQGFLENTAKKAPTPMNLLVFLAKYCFND